MTATNAPSYATELSAEQKAHEPSMEDILASIRRMIADDDALPLSRRARAAARSRMPTPDEVAATPQKAPADGFLSLVHRLGRESDGHAPDILPQPAVVASATEAVTPGDSRQEAKPEAKPERAPAPHGAPPLRLRDFALKNFLARPAPVSEPETHSEPLVEPLAEPLVASLAAGDLRPSLGEAEARAEPAAAALASSGASVVMLSPRPAHAAEIRLKIAPLTFRAPAFAATPVEPAPVPEPVAETPPTPPQPTPQPTSAPPSPEPAEAALLSSASDAKIGASFEALAESLLARDKDLVERAARDMLRPMLKSWLDDNLPSLVERLVRAEIERVARGRG
jgi:cell pole-organizing protein PopZ